MGVHAINRTIQRESGTDRRSCPNIDSANGHPARENRDEEELFESSYTQHLAIGSRRKVAYMIAVTAEV